MNRSSPIGSAVRHVLLGTAALTCLSALGVACLDRPVVPATPTITARVAQPAKQTAVNGIDLLFMIDNSSSMADKQDILADAVPALLERLTNPNCVDPETQQVFGSPNGGRCERGELEFNPVASMHIGIVTSSLGAHGVEGLCQDVSSDSTSHNNDKGELVSRGASAGITNGFLEWKAELGNANTSSSFQNMVRGVGQHGCGYEAQLEAPYRFLIDPDPPDNVYKGKVNDRDVIVAEGTDQTILTQRANFLRPDSLVAVIMVSDENDCSLQEYGQAWLALAPGDTTQHTPLRPGTDACNSNPNDPCCYNCAQETPPAGCPGPDQSSNCVKNGEKVFYQTADDPSNLRCWDQKRRYGIDFLYPIDRYVKGYTEMTVTDRHGNVVQNPLYSDLSCKQGEQCKGARDKALVFVAGIVGVPWQDIANDWQNPAAGFKTTAQDFPWGVILGDPTASPPIVPTDPLMVESVEPRKAGMTDNPVGSDAIPDLKFSDGPKTNPVNGHEWDTSKSFPQVRSDLQYACIFQLPGSRDCSKQTTDCDCVDYTEKGGFAPKDYMSPLCQDPKTGTFGTTQYYAKGYPGIRELQVLKGIGSQAIVASVCAAVVTGNKTDPAYGYNPAVQTLINRLKEALRGKCLPRTIVPNGDKYPCIIYEGFEPEGGGGCNCENDPKYPGRIQDNTPENELPDTIRQHKSKGCVCQIRQLEGDEKRACQTTEDLNQVQAIGWCYVDPTDPTVADGDKRSACNIVKSCPATNRRIIRFAGTNHIGEPRPGADAVILCQEASFLSDGGSGGADPCSTQ